MGFLQSYVRPATLYSIFEGVGADVGFWKNNSSDGYCNQCALVWSCVAEGVFSCVERGVRVTCCRSKESRVTENDMVEAH